MKKRISKLIASFLAVVMVVTAMPFTVFAKNEDGFKWTQVAKTDFTDSSRNWSYNAGASNATRGIYNADNTTGMQWTAAEYQKDGSLNFSAQDTADGLLVNDGYIYLSAYDNAANFPIQNSKYFKVDVAFQYTGTSEIGKIDEKCIFKLSTNSSSMSRNGNPTDDMWVNNFFAQDLYGRFHIGGTGKGSTGNTYGKDYTLGTNNSKLTTNTTYHYVFTYLNGFLSGDLMDENGNVIVNGGSGTTDMSPDSIKGLFLGYGPSFMHNVLYKSVTMSTGESIGEDKKVDVKRDKYLFAYFTGNADQHVRLAVSDDGANWESLNGNQYVMNSKDVSATYPSGAKKNVGIPSSGSARDPFIFQKADGSGYYAIATDLDITQQYGYSNTKLLVWDIDDLGNIGDAKPWNVETCDWFDKYSTIYSSSKFDYFAWAPEAIWDDDAGMYMMYWTAPMIYQKKNWSWESNAQKRLFYAYTDDFKTFYTDATKKTQLGNGVEPNMLFDYDFTSIDADITYDGHLYYMYFKHEDDKDIYYAVSENANGPYCGPKKMDVGYYDSKKLEGCQVFQLYDGTYNFIADAYTEESGNYDYDGFFVNFASTTGLTGFDGNDNTNNGNMNYLTPRHGCVINITTDEYNKLIDRYGKCTIDAPGIRDGSDVNSHLVARYFSTSRNEAGDDATDRTSLSTVNNVEWTQDDERMYAKFSGEGYKASDCDSASYASIDLSNFQDDGLNLKDGVTFDWYGYIDSYSPDSNNGEYSRFFELTTATKPGQFSNATNGHYLFYGAKNGYGVSNASTETDCWGYSQMSAYNSTGKWRRYTLNFTEHYVSLFVDGVLLAKRYIYRDIHDTTNRLGNTGSAKGEGASDSSGSPTYTKEASQEWFNALMQSGKLVFGASSFGPDQMLSGRISDFRIYNKALCASEIKESLSHLASSAVAETLDSMYTNLEYFDPMEDGTFNGETKTGYGSKSVQDTVLADVNYNGTYDTPVHGTVLNNAGSTSSNYTFHSNNIASDKGVTIALGYNNGASVSGNIMKIGGVEITEAGEVKLNGTTIASNVFGDLIKNGEWQHLAFLVIKSGETTILSTYVGAAPASKITISSHDLFNALIRNNDLAVTYGGAGTDGMMDDVVIYDGVYTAYSCYLQSALHHIDTMAPYLCDSFEKMMKSMADTNTVYTNLAPAYTAYNNLLRYLDSVRFGETVADPTIETQYYVDLRVAISNMDEYTKPATKQGLSIDETGVNASVSAQYTQNLLSGCELNNTVEMTQNEDGTGSKGTEIGHKYTTRISSGPIVWLYDGETTPTAPLVGGVYKSRANIGDTSVSIYYIASNDTDHFDFGGLWKFNPGADSANDWYYESDVATWTMGYQNGDTSHPYKIAGRGVSNGNDKKWYNGGNYITYSKTAGDALAASGNYLDSFTIKCTSRADQNSNNAYLTGGKVSVINYIPVKQALTNNISKLANVTDYSLDSVQNFLNAYDALTSMDYTFSGTRANDRSITELVTALETNVNILNGFKTEDFKETIDKRELNRFTEKAEEILNDGNHVVDKEVNTQYTTSSWNKFEQSVQDVKDYYTSLNPVGDNLNYLEKDSVEGSDLVNGVTNARKELVVVADYEPVETVKADGLDNIVNDVDVQVWTLRNWVPYKEAYDVADALASKTEAEKLDTPKYDVTAAGYDGTNNTTWTTKSAQQNEIITAKANVDDTHSKLAEVDSTEAYDAYDKAQERFLTSDQDAYTDAAVAKLNGYGSAGKALDYTPELNSVYAQYNGRIYKNTAANETDAFTKSVLTTINGGTDDEKSRKSYKVTFNYIVNGTPVNQYTEQLHYYGDVLDMAYTGQGTAITWSVSQNGITTYINNKTANFTHKVQCDTTINVYITTNELNGVHQVKLVDYFGRVQVAYVPDGATATINGETINFGDGITLKNQGCNYVTFTGFDIENGAAITADTIIKAQGTKPADTLNYTITGGTFADGGNAAVYKVDDKVTVTAANAENCKGIAIKTDDGYTMLTYASTYSFYAFPVAKAFNGQVDLVAVTEEFAKNNNIDISGIPQSFGIGVLNTSNNKLSMFCTMTTSLSDDVRVVERGIVASASASTADTLIKGASGVKTYRSSSDINSSMYMITFGTSGKTIYTRSYVAYEQTISMNGQEVNVPLVAYGDVVLSSAC